MYISIDQRQAKLFTLEDTPILTTCEAKSFRTQLLKWVGNKQLTLDMAKELAMVENNAAQWTPKKLSHSLRRWSQLELDDFAIFNIGKTSHGLLWRLERKI